MSIQLRPDGTFIFDNVTEALEFTQQKPPRRVGRPRSSHRPRPVGDGSWDGFCRFLVGRSRRRMRKVLALIKGRETRGITPGELSAALGDKTLVAIGGTYGGLRKVARMNGFSPDDLVFSDGELIRAGPLLEANEPPVP